MTYTKSLTRIGNSSGIIIEKPLLEMLDIREDTLLNVSIQGSGLMITPLPRGRSLEECLFGIFIKYGDTLRELAK